MQQLDLFANFVETPQPKTAEKDVVAAVVKGPEAEQKKKTETTTVTKAAQEEQPAAEKKVAEKQQPIKGKRGRKSFKEMDAELVMVEVPDDDVLYQKQYYSISEVAEWFHVNQSLIRFWENEFSILKPRKTRKGDRLFRPEDIKNIQVIYYLLRQRKFSIEGAKQYLKDNRKKVDMQMQLIESLTKFRAFLLEWKANLGS